MSYRPEGWKNPHTPNLMYRVNPSAFTEWSEKDRADVLSQYAHHIYEDGADAMLEALKATGFHVKRNMSNFVTKEEWVVEGTEIFIPDRKETVEESSALAGEIGYDKKG